MRREKRFLSDALVYLIDDSQEQTEASLKDLSEHGLSLKSEDYINIEPNASYVIAVIPEKETQMEKFQLEIKSKWVRLKKMQMESGFSVLLSFNEEEFKEYLEYIAKKDKLE